MQGVSISRCSIAYPCHSSYPACIQPTSIYSAPAMCQALGRNMMPTAGVALRSSVSGRDTPVKKYVAIQDNRCFHGNLYQV